MAHKRLSGENLNQFNEAIELLKVFFKDDPNKAHVWMNTPNLNLGGMEPRRLFEVDRGHKVLQFIQTAFDENTRR